MAPKYILEQFLETELLVNITEHEVKFSFHFINHFDKLERKKASNKMNSL